METGCFVALMIYLSVLRQQEKHDIALEVVSGKLGGLFSIQSDKLRVQVTNKLLPSFNGSRHNVSSI